MRAVAILLVILFHCAGRASFPHSELGLLRPFAISGWSGVDLFFALSGFLITRLLLMEEAAAGQVDVRAFYVRRALRILPAYYLVLALDLLWLRRLPVMHSLAGAGARGPLEIASLLAYWSNYAYACLFPGTPPPSAVGVYWSLCVEEHFYLLWPWLFVFVRGRARRLQLALALCGALPFLRWAHGDSRYALYTLSHYRFDSILWGAIAALTELDHRVTRGARRAALAALALGLAFVSRNGGDILGADAGKVQFAFLLTALAVFGAALVQELATAPLTPVARLLAHPALRAVGRVSYGMYLVHLQVIDLALPLCVRITPRASPAAFALFAATAAVLTFAVAYAMHRLWERPFLRLKERLASPRPVSEKGL